MGTGKRLLLGRVPTASPSTWGPFPCQTNLWWVLQTVGALLPHTAQSTAWAVSAPAQGESKRERIKGRRKMLSFLFLLHVLPTPQIWGSVVPDPCPCSPPLTTADDHLCPSQLALTHRPPAASPTPPGSCPAASWWSTTRPTACAPSRPSCKSSPPARWWALPLG